MKEHRRRILWRARAAHTGLLFTPPKASEEERASMYRELSSSYTPSRSPGLGAVPLASTLSDGGGQRTWRHRQQSLLV